MSQLLRTADAVAHVCSRKTRYSAEYSARRYGQIAIRKNGNAERLYPYACANCRKWHLTKEAGRTPAVTATALWEGIA